MRQTSALIQISVLLCLVALPGCDSDGSEDGGAGEHLSGGGAGGAGAAGGAGSGGTAGASSGSGGSGALAGAAGAAGASAASCVPDRYYPCSEPVGPCDNGGVQRCSQTGAEGSCYCAPACGGATIDTNFEPTVCRIAFTGDPEVLGSGWPDALTVSISEDETWTTDEQINRVEDMSQCSGDVGWYQLGNRAIALCPVSCAAVVEGSLYSVVLGCPTIWRAD